MPKSRSKSRAKRLEEVYPKLDKDSEGYWICRYCGERINQGKRYRAWCSDECSRNAMERTYSNWARNALERRENGICQECGLDTTELDHELKILRSLVNHTYRRCSKEKWHYQNVLRTMLLSMKRCGFNTSPDWGRWSTLWHMDHIVEHAEGGTLEPENLQTLCVACHKKKTKKYVGGTK